MGKNKNTKRLTTAEMLAAKAETKNAKDFAHHHMTTPHIGTHHLGVPHMGHPHLGHHEHHEHVAPTETAHQAISSGAQPSQNKPTRASFCQMDDGLPMDDDPTKAIAVAVAAVDDGLRKAPSTDSAFSLRP